LVSNRTPAFLLPANRVSQQYLIFRAACFDGHFEIVKYLVEHNAGKYVILLTIKVNYAPIKVLGGIAIGSCSARDWERSGLLEENPQSGCTEIRASPKGPL
jgi:hypothetical protein